LIYDFVFANPALFVAIQIATHRHSGLNVVYVIFKSLLNLIKFAMNGKQMILFAICLFDLAAVRSSHKLAFVIY